MPVGTPIITHPAPQCEPTVVRHWTKVHFVGRIAVGLEFCSPLLGTTCRWAMSPRWLLSSSIPGHEVHPRRCGACRDLRCGPGRSRVRVGWSDSADSRSRCGRPASLWLGLVNQHDALRFRLAVAPIGADLEANAVADARPVIANYLRAMQEYRLTPCLLPHREARCYPARWDSRGTLWRLTAVGPRICGA